MDKLFIASRIREEREKCGLRQEDVAKYMNWDASKHSIVVDIEAGKREVKAWELYKLAQLFHIPVESFFKNVHQQIPLILWRNKPETASLKEREFIQRCEDYKFLEQVLGDKLPIKCSLPKYVLDIQTADKAWANEIADIIRDEINLGDSPSSSLLQILEKKYGVRFLGLALGNEGSAACLSYDSYAAVLINTNEVPWRQTFSIAHELFHLITWNEELFNQMSNSQQLYQKNEQLANAFAAGLLMPEKFLRQEIPRLSIEGKIKYETIITIAREYGVSVEALLYRFEYLKFFSREDVKQLLENQHFKSLNKESLSKAFENAPPSSGRFMRIAYLAYQFGKISRSKLARLLNVSLASLDHYLESYGIMEDNNEEIMLSYP